MQLCSSLSILWHCLSLGLEWKLTISSPVATAEFSKFAGILSTTFSQHYFSGFELAQLEFHHQGQELTFSSVQFSHSVMSDSLWPHESQYVRPPCPSTTPRVHSISCPSSRWCHPAISSTVVLFPSCRQSLPASGSFPMSQIFAWGGQSIGVSASAPVLPMNTQDWSPLGWTSTWHDKIHSVNKYLVSTAQETRWKC